MYHTISWGFLEQGTMVAKAFGPKNNAPRWDSWVGNPSHSKNHKRSMSLPDIINDLSPKFDWYSLQIQASDKDIETMKSSGK